MGCADHIERLAAWIQRLADKGHIDYDDGIEVAALLRDTRPRFDGGARAQDGEDRCAPLVEAATALLPLYEHGPAPEDFGAWYDEWEARWDALRDALGAHRKRSGDG